MPVPSIMMGFMLTVVGMWYFSVSLQANFIIIRGPMATTWSYWAPPWISSSSLPVTKPW